MENKKDTIIRILFALAVGSILVIVAIRKPQDISPQPTEINKCKEDSLQNVINQLQIDFENEQDGWDKKEVRYEQIIFEYEIGLEHLKNYHLESYKEFHRIVGYKEHFNHETERENKKRLNINKW